MNYKKAMTLHHLISYCLKISTGMEVLTVIALIAMLSIVDYITMSEIIMMTDFTITQWGLAQMVMRQNLLTNLEIE